ncbi:OmpA family protein [Pseudenhygromyxa sp. WMMC2535]|uniref:OmpA family protein n=1 Tax=Pseudenhygromyxa sp. WMMC2535 TaxID=2712867 RepID=UPI001551E531|nr:OmpA family protein [Pseudenhygromyxa sp. WMMC2535]NVB40814.1 OmpA family protein [Pseudenhygromyxa sp. WMMC2535]
MPARPRQLPSLVLGMALGLGLGCVSVPKAEPVSFDVNDDRLGDPRAEAELERAAAALRDDPDLHLLVIGHADEDNTDEYNRALSRRRAQRVGDYLIEQLRASGDASAATRVHLEARGEWDASDPGDDEAAKARNRRVELRFYYPRQCEPSFDADFLACEWARLPPPEPVELEAPPLQDAADVADTPPPTPAEPKQRPAREEIGFRGPYVFGIAGYAIGSAEYLRQHVRYGAGAGYIWGFSSELRLALGLSVDHLIDVGFLFPQPDSCAPDCDRVDRSRLRVVPELRVGGSRGGFWGWLRLSAGLVLQHREGSTTAPERWSPGAVLGIGPGVAIALTRHLFLLFDATVTYSVTPGSSGGAGIYDVGAGLGWVF